LIDQLSEAFDIVRDIILLSDGEQLTDQEFMLVTIKAIVQQLTKGGPRRIAKLGFDGLKPTSSRTLQIMLGHTDPQGFLDTVHGEILFTATTPQTRIITIEFWKGQLRETTRGRRVVVVVRRFVWRKIGRKSVRRMKNRWSRRRRGDDL